MVERLHAQKTRISEIIAGKYYPGSKEEMRAGYVVTKFGEKLSRVNLIGTVVDKFESDDGSYASITIDDGSDLIRVKAFTEIEMLKSADTGNPVRVIGKLKEYRGEVYVNSEVVKKVDANFEIKHRLEVLQNLVNQKNLADELRKLTGTMSEEDIEIYAKGYGFDKESVQAILTSQQADYKPKILEIIKNMDAGEGVEVSQIFEAVKLPDHIVESTLTDLLDQGYIFEPRPSVLKII